MSNSVSECPECPRKIPCDLFSSFWGQLRLSIIYVVGAIRREGSEVVLMYTHTETRTSVWTNKKCTPTNLEREDKFH
jgi:hypothetical protein